MDVSDEDMEFVKEHGNKIGFLKSLDKAALDRYVSGSIMQYASTLHGCIGRTYGSPLEDADGQWSHLLRQAAGSQGA